MTEETPEEKDEKKGRKVANEWDEIRDLYDRLLYWLYRQEDAGKARPYADKLERLLPKTDPSHEAIFGAECWSLVFEAKGNLEKAITHREHEIDLIRRLHAVAHNQPYEKAAIPFSKEKSLVLATHLRTNGDAGPGSDPGQRLREIGSCTSPPVRLKN